MAAIGPDDDSLPLDDSLSAVQPEVTPAPVSKRELIVVALLVVLADVTIFRGEGYAAYAALFAIAPLLFWTGTPTRKVTFASSLVFLLLALVAARQLWSGSALLTLCGWGLLFAFSMALAGSCPFVLETLVFASQTVRSGFEGLKQYGKVLERRADAQQRRPWMNTGLPAAALLAFGTVFILANPDLVTIVSTRLQIVIDAISDWLSAFSFWEVVFWVAALWVSVGLIRPYVTAAPSVADESRPETPAAEAPLLIAFRNTLLSVIALFAIYLVFEFRTLWFREFPETFFRSGRVHKYAHEGAAWLTMALAMATVVLSLIFRGATLGDPRLPKIRKLAWLWSLENGLLAITVYHRLLIYIGYNGMTRMRVVGLLGISCVVIGFILVVWKIVFNRRFAWLLRRHLLTVALAVLLYALLPLDPMVHRYNVRRVLAGDLAPGVQISVHPITADGYLVLEPLLQSENETIREGIRSMLAERLIQCEQDASLSAESGWSAFQLADDMLLLRLREIRSRLQPFHDNESLRNNARRQFNEFLFQWY
ncbi:MAG: DUF4153 domain-containing protein [Planctomycetaceae bacterium]